MSEFVGHIPWQELYRPLKSARELEPIGSVIPKFSGIQDDLIVIASGSPRNSRCLTALDSPRAVAHLSQSEAIKRLNIIDISSSCDEIVQSIKNYREPRSQWTIDGDSGLSLGKARLIAAAILMLNTEKDCILNLSIIGRDFNVADATGNFLDRPGYEINQLDNLPDGWTTHGEGNPPVDPIEQFLRLYKGQSDDKPRVFYTANSTSVLSIDVVLPLDINVIRQIADLSQPIPEGLTYKTEYSYLALKPTREIVQTGINGASVRKLIEYYLQFPMDPYGKLLYAIPGVVDWSRLPFNDNVMVWKSDAGKIISHGMSALMSEIQEDKGTWVSYLPESANQDVANELVGISTKSIRMLLA
jgi:hypothetical protein